MVVHKGQVKHIMVPKLYSSRSLEPSRAFNEAIKIVNVCARQSMKIVVAIDTRKSFTSQKLGRAVDRILLFLLFFPTGYVEIIRKIS